jgi:hypothetical protein
MYKILLFENQIQIINHKLIIKNKIKPKLFQIQHKAQQKIQLLLKEDKL